MRKFHSRGFAKILEMFIAVSLVFIFSLAIIPRSGTINERNLDLSFLNGLALDSEFRRAVLSGNSSFVNSSLVEAFNASGLNELDFTFSISESPHSVPNLPQKEIRSYSLFISAEPDLSGPKILRVYVWKKERQ
jgi:hypothetical protein